MKKSSILIFICLVMAGFGYAQSVPVTTITYTPQHPTWMDTILFICSTPNINQPFPLYSEQIEVVGTDIHADICYSQSPWLSSYTHIDTVSVTLPVGSSGLHTFHYRYGIKGTPDSCVYQILLQNDSVGIGDTITFEVTEPNGLYLTDQKTFRLFPNPATTFVALESQELLKEVWLTDISGRWLQNFLLKGTRWESDTSKLPAGIYMVVAVGENGRRAVSKLVRH